MLKISCFWREFRNYFTAGGLLNCANSILKRVLEELQINVFIEASRNFWILIFNVIMLPKNIRTVGAHVEKKYWCNFSDLLQKLSSRDRVPLTIHRKEQGEPTMCQACQGWRWNPHAPISTLFQAVKIICVRAEK